MEFNTNTGKIELYSTDLAGAGFDPMPKFTAHEEPQAGYYRMIYGRVPMHTFDRTMNNPFLHELRKESHIWINPIVANEWGLKDEQKIWLQNQDGVVSSFSSKIRITERIRFDSVFVPHGFGQTDKRNTRSYGNGIMDSEMMTKIAIDDIMGGTGMRGNFVTFLTTDPRKEAEA
jgi:thiosulfate reductase/polysulfide reductase chain A